MEAIHRLTSISVKDVNYYYCLTKLHLARSDAESAIECINEAIAIYGETEDLQKALDEVKEMIANGLAIRCISTWKGHRNIRSVYLSPDGKLALSGSCKSIRSIKLWNVKTGKCICTFEGHKDSIISVCFSPDGKHILSGSLDNIE